MQQPAVSNYMLYALAKLYSKSGEYIYSEVKSTDQ